MKITTRLIGFGLMLFLTGCHTAPVAPAPAVDNNSPRLVIPASGGAPITAIPVGGNLYLPVTGGPPIPGIPIQ